MYKKIVFLFGLILLALVSLNSVSAGFADNGSIQQNVYDCGTLNTTNALYTLNQSINSSFDCLIINATNITLDCAGYTIIYGNATGGWGVAVVNEATQVGFDNIIVRNCVIIQNESGVNGSAIFFGESSEDSVVYNNTITVYGNGTSGILFEESSVGANISLNNITTSGGEAYGIYVGYRGSAANITSNTVVTSGNDSSGIFIDADSITLFNNTIVTYGNRTSLVVMGGIFLETGTNNMNVSSNNITTFGVDGAGIWIWGSNSSIDNNIITTSGELGDGIYLNGIQGINLTSNTITLSGDSGDGIHSVMSDNSPLIFYNNIITTSGNYSYGINLNQDSNNNISSNNITTSGNYSYGMFFNQSHNTILANNVITTGESNSYVLYLITSANETFYNNIFNTSTSGSGVSIESSDLSYFNTTKTLSTNIIGKTYIGGNYWTNNASTGYSDNCFDSDGDYICDSAYNLINSSNDNKDYLPLTYRNNVLTSCTTLSIQGRVYYINQSFSVNGTCFSITANNVTLNLNDFNITGNTTGYGVNVTGYNDITILNGSIYNFLSGIYISSSSGDVFNNININGSQQDAILLIGATSDNNNFTSITVTNTNDSFYDINFSTAGIDGTWIIDISGFENYTFTGAGGLVNFKEPSYGEIVFLEAINGSGISLKNDVDIESNSVFVNSSKSGLNKSANITLYSITYTDPKPQYSSDGSTYTDCTATTDPACSELSFSGNVFKFNTTHFTYFRATEAYTAPSGGGGGGGTPSVTYDEQSVGTLAAGSTKAVTFTKSVTLAVTEITVTVKNKVTNAKIKVDVGSLPSGSSVPSSAKGSVYKYIIITKTAMTDSDVSKGVIKFKVKKSWLTDKGYGKDTIVLHRYYNNKWAKLTTTRDSQDITYYYYSAESPGFSTFAITAEEAPVVTAPPPEEAPEEAEENVTTEVPPEETLEEEELEEETKSNTILIVALIAVVIILAVAGYFVKQKKQKKH